MYIIPFFPVLLYLGFIYVSTSASPCLSESSCRCVLSNNSVIDLSTVGSPEFVRFYDVSFRTNITNCSTVELYSYNPCFAFDSPDRQTKTNPRNTPCSGASACMKTPGSSDGEFPEIHAIGLQNTAKFTSNGSIMSIEYTVPNSERKLKVILECDPDKENILTSMNTTECVADKKEPIHLDDLKVTQNRIKFTRVLMLTSKCACADGCLSANPTPSPSSTGLSIGSKLLIAFFTILIAYLLIGIVWNYCNGAHGLELVPNIEFWNELPTLIMEGVAFTCSCCGRTSSYGEV